MPLILLLCQTAYTIDMFCVIVVVVVLVVVAVVVVALAVVVRHCR